MPRKVPQWAKTCRFEQLIADLLLELHGQATASSWRLNAQIAKIGGHRVGTGLMASAKK